MSLYNFYVRKEKLSLFTIDENENELASLSYGEEFNDEFWQTFKYFFDLDI